MDSLSSNSASIILVFLAFFPLLLSLVHAKHDTLTPINRDLYHSSADLMKQIEALVNRHPNKLSIETIESGNKGYQAQIDVVTYCRDTKEDDKSKFRILLTFGQHARELITSELALRILSILSEEEFLPKMDRKSLNSTLDKLLIKIVPMENVNGRKRVEGGDLCERRNGRGVDLNRNWSVDWGKKEEEVKWIQSPERNYQILFRLSYRRPLDYDPYEENPGTAPFSEPESQIMRKLALTFQPHLWVNVHSGMQALFMPYDHRNTTPDGASSTKMTKLVNDLNYRHFQGRCMTGSGGGSVGYLAHGTATDYIYEIAKVPMAFTFEIFGDQAASGKDCFRMFNPIDQTTFKRVLNDWSAAFFTIFKFGPQLLGMTNSEESVKWISIDDYLDGYLMSRRNRYGKKMEVFELGLQEIRSYFRLFMLSCIILMFMFCTRISKSKLQRPTVSALPP